MSKIVYTAIIGEYDNLLPPLSKQDWRFICYTTNKNLTSKDWEIVYLKQEEDKIRQARKIKIITPFNYDECIWIDGNIQVVGKLNSFLTLLQNKEMCLMNHPHRTNLIEEAFAIIKYKKDDERIIQKQLISYAKHEYNCCAMSATGIIYRKNTQQVKDFCNLWYEHVLMFSHRDQMSVDFCAWKENFNLYKFDYIPSQYFMYHPHAPHIIPKHKHLVSKKVNIRRR